MPLYEYACHRCGKTFEVIQKFSDQTLTVHEDCGGTLERLLSVPTLQFKGSGWYVNDYAGSKNPSNGGPKSEPKAEPKKTESTPASKSPEKSSKT